MSYKIPKTQIAAVVPAIGAELEVLKDYPVKQADELAPGECLVKIIATGVCHTDLHVKKGDWPIASKHPLVGGHEGVGTIVAIGRNTPVAENSVKVGDRVGIKWLAYSCLQCEFCRKGLEQACQSAKLSGFTVDGTFSEYVVSYVNHVTPIPEQLDSKAAASILCAGVTSYRALKYSDTHIGDWIVIPGAGGGLGHLAVQYASAMGLRVVAIDTGEEKRKLVLSLGAEKWIDFKTTKDLVQDIKDATDGLGPHASIVTAANSEAYSQAVDYLRPTGTMMLVGLPAAADLNANVFFSVLKCLNFKGSYVGNRQDAVEALAIAAAGKVKVIFETKDLSDLAEVYHGLEQGKVAGRIVLDVEK
ncbi:GroES-like protein [Sistotremastrum suecicum HHB10207 ss-3]|uniref:alcohol dehydrogenase n=1 Tax=Sistotremastrum suecicum HHB10207 ss-3 TaxID=1314776 RepID=A0A165X858_9AGAM|nr:GroES-like protein [Sistotremastrum suecicum HHB10207 ss-3]